MDHPLPLFSFVLLLVAFAATSHAASSSEEYWHQVLPNTPMPSVISELLHPDLVDEKAGTAVNIGKKDGVHVDAGKGTPKGGTTVNVGKGGVNVDAGKGKPKGGTNVGVGRKGVGVNTGRGTHVNVGKGGVGVKTGPKKKPVVVRVNPGKSPFNYLYAASEDQLHDNPNVAIFFLEKDLHPGTKMNLQFTKTTTVSTFLPRSAADKIPFSSTKLSDILSQFSIASGSPEAETMKETLDTCEEPASNGETKYCATSVESMVDFARTRLGSNLQVLSTEVKKEVPSHEYTIGSGVQKMASTKSVACHSQSYVYAVYYCHETRGTTAYKVPLVGKDGTHVEAVAICHKDTSAWNPKHLAFQVLKVKPGSVPVCHFLPQDHLVWVAK